MAGSNSGPVLVTRGMPLPRASMAPLRRMVMPSSYGATANVSDAAVAAGEQSAGSQQTQRCGSGFRNRPGNRTARINPTALTLQTNPLDLGCAQISRGGAGSLKLEIGTGQTGNAGNFARETLARPEAVNDPPTLVEEKQQVVFAAPGCPENVASDPHQRCVETPAKRRVSCQV